MPCRLGPLALLSLLLVALSGRAEPLERGALRLEWRAPGGCPNGVEVLERIEALLGARVADLRPEPISARGKVTQVEALRFELELETHQRDQRFVRSMQAPSCAELTDAGALVLALAIDPTLAERQARAAETTETASPGAPETSALPTEPPPLPPAQAAKPRPSRPVRTLDSPSPSDETPGTPPERPRTVPEWSASLGLVADLGAVSNLALGPRATVGARVHALRVDLGILWLPPARSVTAENPERGGDIDLLAGDLAACLVPFRGNLEIEGCAGAELGRLHGAGFGTVADSEGSATWFGVGVNGGGRFRATDSLAITLHGGYLFVPQDIEFTLENVGVVHSVPRAVGRLVLALQMEFE